MNSNIVNSCAKVIKKAQCTMHNAQFFDFRYSFQNFLVTLQGKMGYI